MQSLRVVQEAFEFSRMKDDQILDIPATLEELRRKGLKRLTIHQVRRWATNKVLPFYKLEGRHYIQRGVLHQHLENLQQKALS